MNGEWMLASTIVALLMYGATAALQRVVALYGGIAIRWLWVGAVVGSASLPLAWLVRPHGNSLPEAGSQSGDVSPLPDGQDPGPTLAAHAKQIRSSARFRVELDTPHVPRGADGPLILMWCGLSATLLAVSLAAAARLTWDRRRWASRSVAGQTVLVSADFGPAVVGVLRPRIVLPTWVLDLDEHEQRLIVRHEAEHLAAHDTALLRAALALLILTPWNLGVWMQWRGLRRAVEIDCDARVLRRGVARTAYAEVLLRACALSRGGRLTVIAFAEGLTSLSSRIEHLMRPRPRRRAMKTTAGVLVAVGVIAIISGMRAPRQEAAMDAPYPLVIPDGVKWPELPSNEIARFGDTHNLVVAERLESNPVAWVSVSTSQENSERHPAHFFIAFIVDTAGRVERGSIRFVGKVPEVFRGPQCAELMNTRFRPVRRAGVARRAFMIHGRDFWPGGNRESLPTTNMLFDSTRAAVFGHGVDAAVEHLKALPHC